MNRMVLLQRILVVSLPLLLTHLQFTSPTCTPYKIITRFYLSHHRLRRMPPSGAVSSEEAARYANNRVALPPFVYSVHPFFLPLGLLTTYSQPSCIFRLSSALPHTEWIWLWIWQGWLQERKEQQGLWIWQGRLWQGWLQEQQVLRQGTCYLRS